MSKQGWLFGQNPDINMVLLAIEEEIDDDYIEEQTEQVLGFCPRCKQAIVRGDEGYEYDSHNGYIHSEEVCPFFDWDWED